MLPTLEEMKRNTGNWMIASQEWGGYAYAKVCSNGNVVISFIANKSNLSNESNGARGMLLG